MKLTDEIVAQGYAKLKSGDYEQALNLFSEAALIYKQNSDLRGETNQLRMIAEIYRLTEKTHLAIETCSKLIGLFERLGDE